MTRTANQILASARTLAPTRHSALADDRAMAGRVRSMARRLRAEGILGPEIAELFGVKSQQVYTWLDGQKGPTKPSEQADHLRAEAKALAVERRRVRAAAAKVNDRARSLAVEVRGCEGLEPGKFVSVLGVHRSQFYTWLDQADRYVITTATERTTA